MTHKEKSILSFVHTFEKERYMLIVIKVTATYEPGSQIYCAKPDSQESLIRATVFQPRFSVSVVYDQADSGCLAG